MSLCHVDTCPKMQHMQGMSTLPSQLYPGPATFDGSVFPILELRKEKSRDAARSRRGKENYEFYELAKLLPLPGAITSQLDKASIIRLTISYLKLRDFSSHGDPPWNRDGPPPNKSVKGGPPRRRSMAAVAMEIFETHQGSHILQSLDGFAFALSNDGRFLYISETVSIYLGLSQVEMTGSSVFDYIHVADHSELAEQLGLCLPQSGGSGGSAMPSPASNSDDGSSSATTPRAPSPPLPDRAIMNPNPNRGYDRSFCVRMKSTLTKRGVHVKCSGYRVVQIMSHMRPQFSFSLTRKHPPPLLGLVGMAIALPPPTINELLIDNDMFVTRLSPELKIIYCEPRIGDLMDITADDITNKNLYDYCHAEDLHSLRKSHVDLLGKGQVLTEYYRLMNKHGGFIWIQTCATIICNAKNAEDQNIIAINYVLSGIEYGGCVMDTNQLRTVSHTKPDQSDHSESETGSDKDERKDDIDGKSPAHKDRSDGRDTPRGQKRKHPNGQDEHQGVNKDMADVEPTSPDNPLSLLYESTAAADGNGLNSLYDDGKYNGVDRNKLDNKNISRRKMEKPKRRKRESESETDNGTEAVIDVDNDPNSIENILNSSNTETLHENGATVTGTTGSSSRHSSVPPPSPPDISNKMKSPAPEDLSVKTPQAGGIIQSPPGGGGAGGGGGGPGGGGGGGGGGPVTDNPSSADDWHTQASGVSDPYSGIPVTTSSVRDLEDVMNKHLPALSSDAELRSGFHSDYSSSQGLLGYKQHKSTIQWIGSQHAHNPDHLPATQLLRTLYANRESVIRSNVYNPRPQYYGDMQGSLLTPPGPGTENYKDTSPFSVPQVNSTSKTPPATYGSLMSSAYPSNPISVMSTNMSDSYSMTPPSSVSPQDKYASPFPDQCHTETSQYRQYTESSLPIKPHAYPLPAHVNSASYDRSGAQYAAAGYYAQTGTFPGYAHASSPTPAHYRDATKNGNW